MKKYNTLIDIRINVVEILNHPILQRIFDAAKTGKSIGNGIAQNTKDEWINVMIENYKRIYTDANEWVSKGKRINLHKIKFNLINNLLWTNGEIDFTDEIYYKISIPYDSKETDKDCFGDDISIRLFVLNGILKIQVGPFDEKSSPKNIGNGHAYQNYVTISSFPLIYFQPHTNLPTEYMNFGVLLTDLMHSGVPELDIQKAIDNMHLEKAQYEFVSENEFSSDTGRYSRDERKLREIYDLFAEKRTEWLHRENFVDDNADKEKKINESYNNNYWSIKIVDYLSWKENRDYRENRFADFYEQREY
jgi:hypothetical protein